MKKVISTDYMNSTLSFFQINEVNSWLKLFKKIDGLIKETVTKNIFLFEKNGGVTPKTVQESIINILKKNKIVTPWEVNNLEAFHGYTVYGFPDNGYKKIISGNKDMYYGLAKATSYGITHKHHKSNAYNLVLDGNGVFCGDPDEKFPYNYHGKILTKGLELEIPIGMTHGHLVKKDHELWFLFVQECGFKRKLKCAGDFYPINYYDTEQFGKEFC